MDGVVLAAMVHDDRDGVALAGLSPALAEAVRSRLATLEAMPRERRHQAVRALIRKSTFIASPEDVPARAGAILAADVPAEVGRRWARAAPPVRRGFEVSRSLKLSLRRLAPEGGPDTSAEDVAAALELDRLPPERAAAVRRVAERLGADAERAVGGLVLGARGRGDGDSTSRRMRRLGLELALVWELADTDGGPPCRA